MRMQLSNRSRLVLIALILALLIVEERRRSSASSTLGGMLDAATNLHTTAARWPRTPCSLRLSSGLFAYVWPLFNGGTALLLGLATALLYHRFRHLLPGITASAVLIILSTFTLAWRSLVKG